ncbi:MAG: hypothetical protein KatS3mg102_1861 [Planctomycetota bacterium]|nr:MAG: hypothetical protein KatS3mg102_1861 [Planctomycetota bacterium]
MSVHGPQGGAEPAAAVPPPQEPPAGPARPELEPAGAEPAPSPTAAAAPAGEAGPAVPDARTALRLALAAHAAGGSDPSLIGEVRPFGAEFYDVVVHRRLPSPPYAIVEPNLAVYRVRVRDGQLWRLEPAAASFPDLERTAPGGETPGAEGGLAPWRKAVRATVYLEDPVLGTRAVELRLPGEDFLYDEQGRPLPGPVGPRVRIEPDRAGYYAFEKLVPDEHGRFVLEAGDHRIAYLVAFAAANRVHRLAERYAGVPIEWGGSGYGAERGRFTIDVRRMRTPPERLNAYADLRAGVLEFTWVIDPEAPEPPRGQPYRSPPGVVYDTAWSMDVVAHEAGHAVFDSLKPTTREPSADYWALHEAWGDITALLHAFSLRPLVVQALEHTGGDLRRRSWLSEVAEGFRLVYTGGERQPGESPPGVRSGLAEVRHPASEEPHARGEPLVAAFYELVVRSYEARRARGVPPADAAQRAAEEIGTLFFQGLAHVPDSGRLGLTDVATGILLADRVRHGGQYHEQLRAVFAQYGLLDEQGWARVEQRLQALPALRRPEGMAQGGSLKEALRLLPQARQALGWPAGLELHPWRVVTDRWGYTRVGYLQPEKPITRLDPDGLPSVPMSPLAAVGAAHLVFDPQGRLVDAQLDAAPGSPPAAPPRP